MTDVVSARVLIDLCEDLKDQVTQQRTTAAAMQAVTQVAVSAVPGAEFASITRRRADKYETAASTDHHALDADRLQYDLNTGPCVDAVDTGHVFHSDDLETDHRWPRYGALAAQTVGVRSVLSIRLTLDGYAAGQMAGLNMYARAAGAFDDTSQTIGTLLAVHASLAVEGAAAREKAANLEIALESSREIGIGIGVLMATYKVTSEQAFDLLRLASQHTHRKLRDVAASVAETGDLQLPSPPSSRRGSTTDA